MAARTAYGVGLAQARRGTTHSQAMNTYTIENRWGTAVATIQADSQLDARVKYAASLGMNEAFSTNFTAVLAA